ncbi:hypothetical protein [Sphingomonas sp.]|uniref:hypothetical protein n=1 Tax=Sphingomonas sp. TaxID=28214 RepID=UPI003B0088FD
MPSRIAFLFLGETLLIPHLYPVMEALARRGAGVAIDCWVATGVHERLIAGWLADAGLARHVRLRRAPGWRALSHLRHGENPPLGSKLPMLLRLAPRLLSARIVVCAEQTSLWLPRAFPFLSMRFVKTSHGVGSMSARDDPRRRAAYRMLVPSELERATYLDRGFAPERVIATGYVKSAFRPAARARPFDGSRPVLVYAPHWQRHRSSWWAWGREIVAMLAAQDRFDVILAPHQRLAERDPASRAVLAAAAGRHVHIAGDDFNRVDGTHMAAADLYLGDTSSQIVEYLANPRPCVFLNPGRVDWRATDDHDFWACGEVVDRLEALFDALARAVVEHPRYVDLQRAYAVASLGVTGSRAAENAADAVLAALA